MSQTIQKYYKNPYWEEEHYELANMYLQDKYASGMKLKDAIMYSIDNVNSQIAFDNQCEENIRNNECVVLTASDGKKISEKIRINIINNIDIENSIYDAFKEYIDIYSLWSCYSVSKLVELILKNEYDITNIIDEINELINEEFEDGQCYKASKNIESSKYDSAGFFLLDIN